MNLMKNKSKWGKFMHEKKLFKGKNESHLAFKQGKRVWCILRNFQISTKKMMGKETKYELRSFFFILIG